MNRLDRLLQDWRIGRAIRFVPLGSRVLDVGCHDGALFRRLGPGLREGIGLDPALAGPPDGDRYRLLPGSFPLDAPDEPGSFDAITMLAVLEHVPSDQQPSVAGTVHRLLKPGRPPDPDRAVAPGRHHPRRPHAAPPAARHGGRAALRLRAGRRRAAVVGAGLTLVEHATFQLGLNHLFVFERPPRTP